MTSYDYGYSLQRLGRFVQARDALQKTITVGHGGVKLAAEKALKKIKKTA